MSDGNRNAAHRVRTNATDTTALPVVRIPAVPSAFRHGNDSPRTRLRFRPTGAHGRIRRTRFHTPFTPLQIPAEETTYREKRFRLPQPPDFRLDLLPPRPTIRPNPNREPSDTIPRYRLSIVARPLARRKISGPSVVPHFPHHGIPRSTVRQVPCTESAKTPATALPASSRKTAEPRTEPGPYGTTQPEASRKATLRNRSRRSDARFFERLFLAPVVPFRMSRIRTARISERQDAAVCDIRRPASRSEAEAGRTSAPKYPCPAGKRTGSRPTNRRKTNVWRSRPGSDFRSTVPGPFPRHRALPVTGTRSSQKRIRAIPQFSPPGTTDELRRGTRHRNDRPHREKNTRHGNGHCPLPCRRFPANGTAERRKNGSPRTRKRASGNSGRPFVSAGSAP